MSKLIFLVEEAPEGGLTARALGESIFTEADGVANLCDKVRDAVRRHFEEGQVPKVIHGSLGALLTEVKERGKVDGVGVAALMRRRSIGPSNATKRQRRSRSR